jgi:hypothetical protein
MTASGMNALKLPVNFSKRVPTSSIAPIVDILPAA